MEKTKLLYKYLNGNVEVCLYSDGTKTQEWPGDTYEDAKPDFPNSMDIKITNYCDLKCPFCHEISSIHGEHGDLMYLLNILVDLPEGTELAIGGGNPLSHPDLLVFLNQCKNFGLVVNMTVNGNHISQYSELINLLINQQLIYGLGVSISDTFFMNTLNLIENRDNIVLHLIAGVNNINILDKIGNSYKCLILGYKNFGRGKDYVSDKTNVILNTWDKNLPFYIGKTHLSFDNLAITQLHVRRFFNEVSWKNFYMGNDGQFTMYIDAVNKNFGKSSTSTIRYLLSGHISDIFKTIRNENNPK